MTSEQTINISGMHCGACVNRVTKALKNVPGVEVEQVEVGSARVRIDDAQTGRKELEEAIRKIGFEVQQ
jgi:copper chaperone CopZ